MVTELDGKKMMLEQERERAPLKDYCLKQDYIGGPENATLIYYGIEPGDFKPRNIQIINAFDYLGIYQVLIHSKFIISCRHNIELSQFIDWLEKKGFEVPAHLKKNVESQKNEVLDSCELLSIQETKKIADVKKIDFDKITYPVLAALGANIINQVLKRKKEKMKQKLKISEVCSSQVMSKFFAEFAHAEGKKVKEQDTIREYIE